MMAIQLSYGRNQRDIGSWLASAQARLSGKSAAFGCADASDFYEPATRSDFPAGVRPVVQVGQ